MEPLKFTPIPKKCVWGGHGLKKYFRTQEEAPIGEYWILSSHPNGTSTVASGPLAGKTLNDLTNQYPQYFLGNSPQKRFPLLIKFLEVTKELSVQVHPHDDYAKIHEGDLGKTECWYILETKKKGSIIYGHRFKSKVEFLQAVEKKQIREYLVNVPIQSDQTILVPSRTLHALLSGTVLIEVQQTSDVTYRIYDWDRVDKNRNSRELHIEKAADVLLYEENPSLKTIFQKPYSLYNTTNIQHERLVECPYFTVERINLHQEKYMLRPQNKGNPDILVVAGGTGFLSFCTKKDPIPLYHGDAVLLPSSIEKYHLYSTTDLKVLRVFY